MRLAAKEELSYAEMEGGKTNVACKKIISTCKGGKYLSNKNVSL